VADHAGLRRARTALEPAAAQARLVAQEQELRLGMPFRGQLEAVEDGIGA
jgi:hypothetical protein